MLRWRLSLRRRSAGRARGRRVVVLQTASVCPQDDRPAAGSTGGSGGLWPAGLVRFRNLLRRWHRWHPSLRWWRRRERLLLEVEGDKETEEVQVARKVTKRGDKNTHRKKSTRGGERGCEANKSCVEKVRTQVKFGLGVRAN